MQKFCNKNQNGFVALIFVIMITSLFIVSSVIIAMINTSNNMANYHVAETDEVMYNIDACLSDAMWQIASSTNISGDYSIGVGGVECAYKVSVTDSSGYKIVTSTATTSSSVGNWSRSVVMLVNVSSSPFFISSHKDDIRGLCLNNSCCGNGVCNSTESCSSCTGDCGSCPVCGNGVTEGSEACDDGDTDTETQTCGNLTVENGNYCNANCTAEINLTEVCDDGGTFTEGCGNGVKELADTYCNADCSAEVVISVNEVCDYTGGLCPGGGEGAPHTGAVGCSKNPYCNEACSGCTNICPTE